MASDDKNESRPFEGWEENCRCKGETRCCGCTKIIDRLFDVTINTHDICYLEIEVCRVDECHDGITMDRYTDVTERWCVFAVPDEVRQKRANDMERLLRCFVPRPRSKCTCCELYYEVKTYAWLDVYSKKCDSLVLFLRN